MTALIHYHETLVKVFLFVVVINMLLPYIFKNNLTNFIKYTRIGFFAFWGAWAMVVFSGLIVFVFMKQPQSIAIYGMIAAAAILPFLDGFRAVKLTKIWKEKQFGNKFNLTILLIELAIIILITVLSIKFK